MDKTTNGANTPTLCYVGDCLYAEYEVTAEGAVDFKGCRKGRTPLPACPDYEEAVYVLKSNIEVSPETGRKTEGDESLVFFPCSCGGHAVSVGYLPDAKLLALSFWRQGDQRQGLLGRLRQIGCIVRHGTAWADMVVLDARTARDLATCLLGMAKKLEKETC